MYNAITNSNGQEIKVGATVWFKADVEQPGKVIKIERVSTWEEDGYLVTLAPVYCEGFVGDYIAGQKTTKEHADRCFA